MKRYNHVNTIRLGKPNTMYCSRIDGTVIYINSITWFRDKYNGHKCCVVRRNADDKRLYTSDEFHEEFKEFISREEELIKETTKAFTERIIKAMDSANKKKIANQNSRIYPIFTYDLVASPGFSSASVSKSTKLKGPYNG